MVRPSTGGPASARSAVGVAACAVAAAVGALMLGEYELDGWLPVVAGPLLGLVVAEVAVGVGGRRRAWVAGAAALASALGLLWAGWLDSGEGVAAFPVLAWVAAALGAAAAAVRSWPRRATRKDDEG